MGAVDSRTRAQASQRHILLKSIVGVWEKYRVTFSARVSKNLLGQLHSLVQVNKDEESNANAVGTEPNKHISANVTGSQLSASGRLARVYSSSSMPSPTTNHAAECNDDQQRQAQVQINGRIGNGAHAITPNKRPSGIPTA